MIRMTSWPVGARELLARPVSRAGAQPLRRLAAPMHAAWFWPALWALTAAASFIAMIPVLFPDGPAVPGHEVMHRISGVSFAVCGLITWRRRPDSDVGRLLTIAGFGVLLSPVLSQVHTPLTLTVAALLDEGWIMVFAWLILSFVTGGRLVSTLDVALVGAFFVGLFVFQFAVMLFLDVPDNLLLVWPDAGIADALQKVQMALLAAAALAVAVVVAGRWRAASAPRRRALLPSIGGAFCGVLYAAVNV